MKISYISGPGNVVRTYGYWQQGKEDPTVSVKTYSGMAYDLAATNGYELQVITQVDFEAPQNCDPWLRFDTVTSETNSGNYWKSQISRVIKTREKLTLFNPDVVIVSSDVPLQLLPLLRSPHWKLILSIHNTYWPAGRQPFSSIKSYANFLISRFSMASADGAVCISPECERQISRLSPKPIPTRLEMPIPIHNYSPSTSHQARKLAYFGRIEENKGIFMILETFGRLKQEFPDLQITFAGSGTAEAELKSEISRIGDDAITFVGRLNAPEVHEFLDSSDLLLVPTKTTFNEGLAFVVFEAAVHQVPSIVSDVVPAKDYFKDACVVFEADKSEELYSAIKGVVSDPIKYQVIKQRLEETIKEVLESKNNWGECIRQLIVEVGSNSLN